MELLNGPEEEEEQKVPQLSKEDDKETQNPNEENKI